MFLLLLSAVTAYSLVEQNAWAMSLEVQSDYYVWVQVLANVSKIVLTVGIAIVFHVSKLYQSIHDDMIRNLLFSPYSYFERVPSDKIINRLSSDLSTNDKIITSEFSYGFFTFNTLLSSLFSVYYVYLHFGSYLSII